MTEVNDNSSEYKQGRVVTNLKTYIGTLDQLKEVLSRSIKNSPGKESNKVHCVYIYSTNDRNVWFYKHTYSLSDSILSGLISFDVKLYEKYEVKKHMKPVLRIV